MNTDKSVDKNAKDEDMQFIDEEAPIVNPVDVGL